ncbi:MAG: hypothetical protein LBH26_02775 [Treponema sp.]|jgi:hypothetical protein|nr:hypothetical protein [Treponema sp.]
MKRLPTLPVLLLFCSGIVFGADFGAALQIDPEWKGAETETDNSYAFTLGPWFSASPQENFDLYLSAGLSLRYEYEEWKALPELYRFMLAWRPLPRLGLELGRVRFSDPNSIVAAGLFDGFSVSYALEGSRLSAGAYYTGFLYKDTADIYLNASDIADYQKPLDWEDAAATYFASRRMLASLSWEAPALAGSPHGLYLNGLAQFDLNGEDDRLHSQYLSLRFLFSPLPLFNINAGGVLSLAEQAGTDTETGLALLLNADWYLPTAWRDTVSLGFRWGSGEDPGPFLPVSSVSQGNVWNSGLSGLMLIRAAYTLRPYESLSLVLDGRYFFLDSGTGDKALGGELFGSLNWAPVMDVTLRAGAGAFFPGMGNALPSDAPLRWLISAGLTLSF